VVAEMPRAMITSLRVEPGTPAGIRDRDPRDKLALGKADAKKLLAELHERLAVVPADRNWVKAVAVAELLTDALDRMEPKLPTAEPGVEGLLIE
jgi:hypothetical protein